MQNEVLNPVSNAVAIVTHAEVNPLAVLDGLLAKLVNNASSTGDVIAEFARELCKQFDKSNVKWFDLKGKEAKPVNEYRTKFVEKFEEIKNPDGSNKFETATITSYWARVKTASGKVSQAKVSGDIINVRALTLNELMTMLRRVQKAEGDDRNKFIDFALVADEYDLLVDVFTRLCGEYDSVKKEFRSPL